MSTNTTIAIQGEANIPTDHGMFTMQAYAKDSLEPMPHLLLYTLRKKWGDVVNVRMHSECMTGDLFGSNRCECGEQLQKSFEYIGKNGGIIIYLRQEGRGIGLINKLHAYVKQDEGYDTVEANTVLGHHIDARTYEVAIQMLNDLNVKKINLLTNNPDKVDALEKSNIEIVNRVPLIIKPKNENEDYLRTKKKVFGHYLDSI